MKVCFDNKKYAKIQMAEILKRVERFNGKLYLEFGGKLFDDLNAARILPGFKPDAKVGVLKALKNKLEVIMVVASHDIEGRRVRGDYGITYDKEVLRQIERIRSMGILVSSIVVTMYKGQKSVDIFVKKLKALGEKVYIHKPIEGYPNDIDVIVSDKGYGANPYIKTSRPIVVVTAPGSGSGKMATCLSQLYHENKRGNKCGYAKYETLPVWNLAPDHPVNIAYEASTADLEDKNMVDPFHLQAYGIKATNYNRDVESFPILNQILTKITGEELYKSPTDMGINMAGFAITDDEGCREASYKEISRRYFRYECEALTGAGTLKTAEVLRQIIKKNKKSIPVRKVEEAALERFKKSGKLCMAIELDDGEIVTAESSELLTAAAAIVLKALKKLAKLPKETQFLDKQTLHSLDELKNFIGGSSGAKLELNDVLLVLASKATIDKDCALAYNMLPRLSYCDAHSSHMLTSSDQKVLKGLLISLSCQPQTI